MRISIISFLLILHTIALHGQENFKTVIKKSIPSVVKIFSVLEESDPLDNWAWRSNSTSELQANGTGIVISEDGKIITCNHVIKGSNRFKVVLSDGKTYNAQLSKVDVENDLALLKINTFKRLDYLSLATSIVELGEPVVTIGYPLDHKVTVSSGIISGVDRSIDFNLFLLKDLIQSDIVVSSGSSGGALINNAGNLLGIIVAVTKNDSNGGYSYAISQKTISSFIQKD